MDDRYLLRSKKRKLEDDKEEATQTFNPPENLRRKAPIMHIPMEILQHILGFLTYHELSDRVRRVNRKFKLASEDLLNREFKGLPKKLEALTHSTFQAIESTEDDMEIKCLCKLQNMLDIVIFQQSVIKATIWRYVYNEFYRIPIQTCMYAGLILDCYDKFFKKFTKSPYQIYSAAVVKDYAAPEEVKNIVQLTKIFCMHFEKVTEEPMKNTLAVSGCKIIDLLDCAPHVTKTIVLERVTNNKFEAKYWFFLRNAWFVAFEIPPDKEMCEAQQQRLMHLRIRRIILAHTEMYMQQAHYEREMLLRMSLDVKEPGVVVYTGYGDVYNTFFCYGAMNDAAYFQKFNLRDEQQDDDGEEDEILADELRLNDLNNNPNDPNANNNNNANINDLLDPFDVFDENDDENESNNPIVPYLGLDINITVTCPVMYAPYRFIKDNKEEFLKQLKKYRNKTSDKSNEEENNNLVDVDVTFNCNGARNPRLPQIYRYRKVEKSNRK